MTGRSPSPVVRGAASALLGVLGGFQVALACGAPWGRAAYGGGHAGVLPPNLRATSGAAAALYAGLVAATMAPAAPWRTVTLTAASALMGAGTVANAASRSAVERALWTPAAAALTGLLWAARTR